MKKLILCLMLMNPVVNINISAQEVYATRNRVVIISASNASSAASLAKNKYPGWSVTKIKKTNKDPKSRTYQVTLTK